MGVKRVSIFSLVDITMLKRFGLQQIGDSGVFRYSKIPDMTFDFSECTFDSIIEKIFEIAYTHGKEAGKTESIKKMLSFVDKITNTESISA